MNTEYHIMMLDDELAVTKTTKSEIRHNNYWLDSTKPNIEGGIGNTLSLAKSKVERMRV